MVTVKCIRRRIDKDTGMLEVTNGYTAKIEQVARHKLLGLTINEDLTYEVHVDELCNKLFKRLGLSFTPHRPILEDKSENNFL